MTQYSNKSANHPFRRDKACPVSTLLILFLLIGNYVYAQDKKESEQISKDILALYKSNRGVVVTCENISIAIELATQADVRIYSHAKDQDAVETARKKIATAGLSAAKIRVEKGPIDTLNYPNFVANIVILSSQIEPASLKEIARILRPEGYLIIIPNKNDKPAIALNDAKSFFTQNSPSNWKDPQKFGNGYVVQKAKLEGAADWSHYFREPDNNLYSPDKLIRDPLRLLWFGEPVAPLGDLFLTQGFSAGGRLFLTDASPADTSRARLTCLDAYNGTLLWVREAGGTRYEKLEGVKDENLRVLQLPGWVQPGSMAVSPEQIYLTDNNDCMVIDSITGKDITRIKAPAPTNPANCWRFVAFQDGLLFGYTNAPTPIPSKVVDPNPIKGGTPTLFVLDQKTGTARWVRGGVEGDELGNSFASPLAIGDNLIFIKSNKTLFALDTKTGKTIWKAESLEDANTSTWWEGAIYKGSFFLYKFNFRTWPNKKKVATLTFSTKDGKLEKESKDDIATEIFFNSKIGFLGTPPNPRLGCNYGSAAGGLYFHRNGYFAEKENTAIMSPTNSRSYGGFRAGCGVGALPANGLVHLLPNGLGCGCAALQGTATLEHDPEPVNANANFQAKAEVASELKSTSEKQVTENDWPTYYGDNARSGLAKQDLTKNYSLGWEVKIKGTPTPCIAVGAQVFVGSTDECLYALNATTGAIVWKFQTTGSIQSAPCFSNNRVYVGSDDGWLYAVSAEDGKLLWKIRGGPNNRKQINFENMISPWPIRQGMLVHQGQVFFTAGLIPGADIYSYSVDGITGNVNWRIPVGKSYIIPCGYLTMLTDSLMIPSPGSASIYHPIILALKDGARQKAQVTHGDFSELRHVDGLETEELGYTKGFMVFGGSEGKRRGYRDGFGYSSRIDKFDGQYSLFPDFFDEGKTKIKTYNPMADGHSFAPLFTNKNVVMRFKNNLICIKRTDLYKFLDTREPTGKEKDVFNQWCIKDLPCGKADWAEIAIGKKDGDTVTVIAGGPKGICAVNMLDGKINWSINWEGTSSPAAIANSHLFTSSPDGTIRAIKPK